MCRTGQKKQPARSRTSEELEREDGHIRIAATIGVCVTDDGEKTMILKQLATSIRRQDWFAVLIEFVVVVAGIFAGLQANDWARERDDRRQEQAALERLFLEADSALQLLDEALQRASYLNQIRRAAIQFADSDAPVPAEDLPLRIGINTLAMFPPILPVTVAYDELKSSGRLQLIRSAALRDQIAEFHVELDYYEQLRRGFSDGTEQYFLGYREHVTWNYNPEATTTDILLSTYDWDSLRSDEAFILDIIGLLRNHLVMEDGLTTLRDQASALCDSLGARVGRTCGAL